MMPYRLLTTMLAFLIGANGAALFWPLPPSNFVRGNPPARLVERRIVEMLPESSIPHPLFHPKPPVAAIVTQAQETVSAPAVAEQTMPRLVGLIVRGQKVRAVFSIAGEVEPRVVREGETVGSWTVESIASRSVRLLQNGHRIVVPLDPEVPSN